MSNTTGLSDDDELLVAYLDGELLPDDRQRVELRLADEERFRCRLQSLQQAWDALDELPREEASAAFTASTVSMAAVIAEKSRPSAAKTRPEPRRGPTWTRVGTVAALLMLGFTLVFVPRRWNYTRKLRDLPVAFNLDRYLDVQSLDFLRRLDREDLFVEESAVPAEDSEQPAEDTAAVSIALRMVNAGGPAEIRGVLESLNPEQQMRLVELYDRFDRMRPMEKGKLRNFHRELSLDPDVDRLTHVLVTFHAWLASLESSTRADIQDLPASQRIEEIRKTLLRQLASSSDSLWMDLTPRDLESIRQWLMGYLQEHREEIIELLPPMQQRRLRQDNDARSAQLMIAAVAWRLPEIGPQLPRPSDDAMARLVRDLPDRVKRRLVEEVEKEGAAPLFEVAARVLRALRQIPRSAFRDRLDEVLNSLPPEEQQRLLNLRPEDLARELRRHAEGQRERGPRHERRGPPPPWDRRGAGPPPRPGDPHEDPPRP